MNIGYIKIEFVFKKIPSLHVYSFDDLFIFSWLAMKLYAKIWSSNIPADEWSVFFSDI